MKLLQVIVSMDPNTGGPCQAIRSLSPRVVEMGHSVEVVCLDDPKADYLAKEPLEVHALGQARNSWGYHPALKGWLEENLPRFDGVILNGLWQFPGYALARAAANPKNPPYFIFPHGMLDPWFQRNPERRAKAIRNWFYWKFLEHKVVSRAKGLLFTCDEELRLARETFRPYQPQREITVGLGVTQPPAFHAGMNNDFAQKCSGLDGKPYLLFLGRIHPKKGVEILIKAYAAVSRANKGEMPKLVIAGPGLETSYGKKMHELATSLTGPNAILWPGMLTGNAKWGALYGSEAFVLTSHQENFGIAVVEALACGRPVLISNQINIWREIAQDKAAFVAEDTIGGAERVLRDWQNLSAQGKGQMQTAARACYESRFEIGVAAQNLAHKLEELLSAKPTSVLSGKSVRIPG